MFKGLGSKGLGFRGLRFKGFGKQWLRKILHDYLLPYKPWKLIVVLWYAKVMQDC